MKAQCSEIPVTKACSCHLSGERKKVLNWLLSYNPLWLRIGLEVFWHMFSSNVQRLPFPTMLLLFIYLFLPWILLIFRRSTESWSHWKATATPWAWLCSSSSDCCGTRTLLQSSDTPECPTFTKMVIWEDVGSASELIEIPGEPRLLV